MGSGGSQYTTFDIADVDTVAVDGPARPRMIDAMASRFGRYEIEHELGRGGMGMVLAGRDTRLGRRVAIKVVRPRARSLGAIERTRRRLLVEARALARLAHPNVVEVYDFGRCGEQVWMAMELVEGETLRRWAERPRPWRAKLAMLRAAARGIAAAHAAGVVHRDVKPDNVLVGSNGRVRVVDFGLAQDAERDSAVVTCLSSAIAMRPHSPMLLTQPGTVMGTPSYMSPEQRAGDPIDERADQYAFCVMAHELLLGRRPDAKSGGLPCADARHVPRRVRAALRQGLQPDPAKRFASMDALVTAMSPTRRRLQWVAAIAGAAVVAGLAWRPAPAPTFEEGQTASGSAAAALDGRNEERLAMVDRAIEDGRYRDALALAGVSLRQMEREGDAVGLARASLRVGRASLLVNEPVAARNAFERAHLEATTSGLAREATDAALGMAQTLGVLEMKTDEAEGWLRRARVGLDASPDLVQLEVRWLEISGGVALHAGRLDEAERAYAAALDRVEAEHGVSSHEAIVPLTGLASIHGVRDDQPSAARTFERAVELQRLHRNEEHPRLATLLTNQGIAYARLQRYDAARTAFEEAKAISERVPAAQRTLPHALNGLAAVLNRLGDHEAALQTATRAASILEQRIGEHPWVANCLSNAGEAAYRLGDHDASEELYSRAHVLWQSTLGGEAAQLAFAEVGLARVAIARGDAAAGEQRIRQALARVGEGRGNGVSIPEARLELARALAAQGELAAAREQARAALRATRVIDGRRELIAADIERWLASTA